MFQVGLPSYPGLNSGRLKRGRCAHVFPIFPSFPYGKHRFQCRLLFSRCKLFLRYTAGNFNKNPSIRGQKICEHEQASTHLIFASNSSKGQILRALSNWMGPLDTPNHPSTSLECCQLRTSVHFLHYISLRPYSDSLTKLGGFLLGVNLTRYNTMLCTWQTLRHVVTTSCFYKNKTQIAVINITRQRML